MRGLATVESKGDTLLKAVMIQKVDTGVTKAQLFLTVISSFNSWIIKWPIFFFFNVLGS